MDRFHAPLVAAGSFVIGAIGLTVINFSSGSSFANFAIGALLLGFTLGVEGDIMPYFVRRYFGTKSFSMIYGVLFGCFSIGGVVGPIAYGMMFDHSGSYVLACSLAAGTCLFCSGAVLTIGRYRYR